MDLSFKDFHCKSYIILFLWQKISWGKVIAVSKSKAHTLQKYSCESIRLLSGLGVEGDAHMGVTVKHRSRVRQDPTKRNLRQVHLMHQELFVELAEKGFHVQAGQMGENITTAGLDLLALPKATILKIGEEAMVEITGLRNPCAQLNSIQNGLMQAVLAKDDQGELVRKAGIMGIVLHGGTISTSDKITVILPKLPYQKLDKV